MATKCCAFSGFFLTREGDINGKPGDTQIEPGVSFIAVEQYLFLSFDWCHGKVRYYKKREGRGRAS